MQRPAFWKEPKAVLMRALGWVLVSAVWIGLRYDTMRVALRHGWPASAFQIVTIVFWVAVLLYWVVIGARSWLVLRRGARLMQETE